MAQKKALRRSAARHGLRMAGSAALAGGVGLVSGLVLQNWRKRGVVARHTKAVWLRLANRARRIKALRDDAIRGGADAAAGQVPVPAETVSDPHRPTEKPKAPVQPDRDATKQPLGDPTREGASMSENTSATGFTRLSEAAEVMLQAASTFDPEHMSEFQTLVDDLPEAMATVQETLRVLAELSDEKLPVDPRVVEEIGEGYRAMNNVVNVLDEVGTVYRRCHAEDIERNENPRKGLDGERRWNVG
ncbi:hypothetical protein ACFV3R_15030 [Streptomyces sp. NPDC059740]|uniref:hypothetical protein n=1 Tax=Streptomyces sp. NPDC059740 TaxID=3346926 RepID=UPI0036612500